MKIYFTLDNNRISSYSTIPMDCGDDTQYEIETEIEFDKLGKCDFLNGKLIYNKNYEQEEVKKKLRIKREKECFNIVNRGQLWYSKNVNTENKLNEFNEWYMAWLDVTNTLVVPTTPSWLKDIL